ncbi:hypothetical protein [Prevotellamassilia timonensis]|uniref:hypothetical protein n=1 Tax=Prevotellamassilia timonensis TaxID=1852370 RepID=UPI001F265D93|nr:hypothetical protein [Prevotellamassilia timonensis]MCF2633942.1 hypothetical protein [Prevotellamassilia timonensis]
MEERKRQEASGERNGGTKKARSERREKRGNEEGKKRAAREMEERKRQKASGERRKGLFFIAAREGFEWGCAPF